MASPPFEVEDQTDEDFFDKLVDDEFGVTESGPGFAECGNSDEVKALSNLSIDEVGTSLEGSSGEGGVAIKEEKHSEDVIVPSSDAPEKDILVAEESISLVSSNSFSFDNLIETSDVVLGAAVASDSTTSKSSESRGISVKEVQWSAFNKDSAQRSGGGFGSYSDFFTELGDNSDDPFGRAENNPGADSNTTSSIAELAVADFTTSSSSVKHQGGEAYGATMQQSTSGQDGYSSQYWENMYPGWRYDSSTGEWHQLDNYDARTTTQDSLESKAQSVDNYVVSDRRSEVSYLQQTTQSVVGTIAEGCTTGSVSNCNQVSQGSTEYPPNMVFDPQYPGWYYDTIAQEWCLLESYTPPVQSMTAANYQQNQNENASKGGFLPDKDHSLHGEYGQVENFGSQVLGGNEQIGDWAGLASNHNQQNMYMWQPEAVAKSVPVASYTESQQLRKHYGFSGPVNNYTAEQMGFKSTGTVPSYEKTRLSYDGGNEVIGFQSFVPAENYSHQLSQTKVEQNQQMHFSHDYYGSQKSGNFPHQPFQTVTQHSYAANEGRSSAGRPPHALVTFGFGGKLIVMKDNSSMTTNSAYGSQDSTGSSVSILNLVEVVMDKIDAASIGISACDYFRTLCQQSFPGPLVGGNVGSKELNKWIDERIANCESPNMDYRKGEVLRLLLSLLKIACQHFGKLRSTFGTDTTLKENDCPESAVAKLFASAKRNGAQRSQYGALTHCLQNMPSEGQILATAAEVQNLLVSGRTKEALQCAQEGQLWGPALILAAQLGDQFYVDTVKQMAHRQLVAGSPLRTLCLLIAGQPRDVFSTDSIALSGLPGGVNISQHPAQIGTSSMLDDWEDNLAIITANPTKDDAFVIVHLGDCLWKDRGEVAAAHTCYLVAEANFESYSDSARLCLIGADHWKYPRTYASPEAIQRTELYEYSQVLGNSQSILLPFQPYKIIYAHILAEVGKVSDSYKYCQSMLKSLKTGRAPEVDTWKQLVSSLEERIRIHQQGGYSTNLAPAKLVGKLLPFIDRSIHRMIGAPPPPVPSTSQSFIQSNEHEYHSVGPRVANSQSTMAMSSLIPSTSMEPISEWTGDTNRMAMPNRSISEPDIGRSPKQGQVGPSKEAVSSGTQGKASVSGGPSRFGRFGSQLLQKTLGWVARSHSDRQAKLGEKNKFYYDEKLKRWVEEGSDPPAEEIAPPPPPTTATFQNGMSDYNVKNAFKSESLPANGGPEIKSSTPERSPGIPPIPPSSNQFSARGRIGVRSRYVDTFNKGGGTPANLFQPASVPAAKPGGGANAKFFIPTPIASGEQTVDTVGERMQETMTTNEDPTTSVAKESLITDSSPPSLQPPSMHRFPSMDNITPIRNKGMEVTENGNGSLPYRSRRTASWSGSVTDTFNLPKITEIKPLGEALSMPPSLFMPRDPSPMRLPMNGVNLGDDLHEVEL